MFAEISNGMPLFPGESDIDQLHQIMRCFGRLPERQEKIFKRNPLYTGVELPHFPSVWDGLTFIALFSFRVGSCQYLLSQHFPCPPPPPSTSLPP